MKGAKRVWDLAVALHARLRVHLLLLVHGSRARQGKVSRRPNDSTCGPGQRLDIGVRDGGQRQDSTERHQIPCLGEVGREDGVIASLTVEAAIDVGTGDYPQAGRAVRVVATHVLASR